MVCLFLTTTVSIGCWNIGKKQTMKQPRKKLIERGIPESEVKFIHEADTDMKKKELFQKTHAVCGDWTIRAIIFYYRYKSNAWTKFEVI